MSLLEGLPSEWPQDVLPDIRLALEQTGASLVVLDDDPTGTQTVWDVPVLTQWDETLLSKELDAHSRVFYLLTNSRSLPELAARALNDEIGRALRAASARSGRGVAAASRGDSTLRGHFPAEVEALAAGLGGAFDAWLLVPCLVEAGRMTIEDVHYARQAGALVPVGETPFARDATFGFQASNLRDWVAEKTGGRIRPEEVASVSLKEIRGGGPQAVRNRLEALSGGRVCVINAVTDRDLEVVALGVLEAEHRGKRFLYRTAGSFVRARAGIVPRPLLTSAELNVSGRVGGLVVVGSHVPATTAQLETCLAHSRVNGVEVSVPRLLDGSRREAEVDRVMTETRLALRNGQDTLVYTSRALAMSGGGEADLAVGSQVSRSLVEIVKGLGIRPRYLIAKGGITSSDLATQALGMRRARVLGQLLPGVPVWEPGPESLYPGLVYVVFPGNVGGPEALQEAVDRLAVNAREESAKFANEGE